MKRSFKIFISFPILLLLVFNCSSDDEQIDDCESCAFNCTSTADLEVVTNVCLDNWDCNFDIICKSKVDITESSGLSSGNKNVFRMENSTEGDINMADDEFAQILVFELTENRTSFSVSDGEIKSLNAYYRIDCFCPNVSFQQVNMGCMQGEKQSDGSWRVQGNLFIPYIYGDVELKFDAFFVN